MTQHVIDDPKIISNGAFQLQWMYEFKPRGRVISEHLCSCVITT